MPLNPMQTSLCNKMMGDYAGLLGPVKLAKSGFMSQKNAISNMLANQRFSPPSTLADNLNLFKNAVGASLPDPNDMNSLKNMLDQCAYLKEMGSTSALAGMTQSALGKIASLIGNFSGSTPEFTTANAISALTQALSSLIPGGSGLTDLLKSADKLLNCVSSICAAGDPSYIGGVEYMSSDLTALYSDMGIVSNPTDPNYGKLDITALYDQAGLPPSGRLAITSVTNTIDEQRLLAKEKIDGSIASVKATMKSSLTGVF